MQNRELFRRLSLRAHWDIPGGDLESKRSSYPVFLEGHRHLVLGPTNAFTDLKGALSCPFHPWVSLLIFPPRWATVCPCPRACLQRPLLSPDHRPKFSSGSSHILSPSGLVLLLEQKLTAAALASTSQVPLHPPQPVPPGPTHPHPYCLSPAPRTWLLYHLETGLVGRG